MNRAGLGVLVLAAGLSSIGAAPRPAPAAGKGNALSRATFAAGCFWCVEAAFEPVPGVVSVTSGYTGGREADPTYKQVSAGGTGHTEAVQIVFDPKRVSYEKLLEVFWYNVDPTTADRQFCDVGSQYRPAIFTHDEAQKTAALASRDAIEKTKTFKEALAVEITPASQFYPAEEYHQDYYKKNPVRYSYYRNGCRRDERLQELWGDKAGGHQAPR
jgi:peptide-methionine (S)-S-oxide reductase